jgi:uncharacterized protein YbjT (DUF2867 family)
MHHRIVVTGATGHVGGEAARMLLAGKQRVRAIGRDAARLRALADLGAETAVGSIEDAAFLARAFDGADAAFAMIPPAVQDPDHRAYQRRIVASLRSALEKARVPHVVSLSSIGAQLPAGTGPIAGLHDLEAALDGLEHASVVHLRPGYFAENHLLNVGLVKGQGINGSMIRADLPMVMIATRDIARVAADLLATPTFTGRTRRELHGARDYTMAEATSILGRAIGRPDLPYVQFPYDAARRSLVGMGLSESMADLYVEMCRAFNDGVVKALEPRTAASTTPTTLETFASTFAEAYRAGS